MIKVHCIFTFVRYPVDYPELKALLVKQILETEDENEDGKLSYQEFNNLRKYSFKSWILHAFPPKTMTFLLVRLEIYIS